MLLLIIGLVLLVALPAIAAFGARVAYLSDRMSPEALALIIDGDDSGYCN